MKSVWFWDAFAQESPKKQSGTYWCVAVHVAAAAHGRVQVVQVDGRQALLRKTVAQAAHQTPGTLAAFGLRVVKCYLHTGAKK